MDAEIETNCTGETFSLIGKDGAECFETVDPTPDGKGLAGGSRNICRARQVWGRLGKLLRREGANPIIS